MVSNVVHCNSPCGDPIADALDVDMLDEAMPLGSPPSTPPESKPPGCSPSADLDSEDRSILKSEFESIQLLTARFDLDACSDDRGYNALVPTQYCSPNNSFLKHNCASQHVWLNPPFSRATEFIQHYLESKASSPHNTSACILVPNWRSASFRPLLKGMQVLKQYSQGTRLFEAPGPTESGSRMLLPGIPWGVTVYYDAPQSQHPPTLSAMHSDDHLLMTFDAKLAGASAAVTTAHSAQAVSDSAASHCFISRAWVDRIRAHVTPLAADDSAAMADGSALKIYGTCSLKLSLGPFHGRVKAYVTDLASHHDLILGEDWLKEHAATLCYHKNAMLLRQGARTYTVQAKHWVNAPLAPVSPLISATQVKRALRKPGAQCFLVLVRKIEADPEKAAAPDSTAISPGPGQPMQPNPVLVPEDKLQALLEKYKHRFSMDLPFLPDHRGPVHHTIPLLPGAKVPPRRSYRLSPKEKEAVETYVKDLLEKGLIEPSSSPFGAPVLFVPKPDGSLRFCIDYRALNAITVKDRYPLPRIDDLLDQLRGTKVYSSLDLLSGYFQARIADEDVSKTAFCTHMGLYQWKVLAMGLSNSPSTFQRLMNMVFEPYIGKFVFVYLDDILVASSSPEEHLHHLELVLEKLTEYDLYAKPTKCKFNQSEVKFLGHIVNQDGIKPDPAKTAAVRDYPMPTTVSQVRTFLGMLNFFRKHIHRYAELTLPFTRLLRKGVPFDTTTPSIQKAFAAIKDALIKAAHLALPDFKEPFQVITDASNHCLGAILLQHGRPLAYESRKLNDAERNYSTHERELLAVVHALKIWRCYLEGSEFCVMSDHCPLRWFMTQPNLSPRQVRWQEYLSRFAFDWVYTPGKTNPADALSRRADFKTLSMITRSKTRAIKPAQPAPQAPPPPPVAPAKKPAKKAKQSKQTADPLEESSIIDRVKAGYALDSWFKNKNNTKQLTFCDGLWLRTPKGSSSADQIVVPKIPALRKLLIQEHHDTPLAGHGGVTKTAKSIQRQYWWPKLTADIQAYVGTCPACQHNKATNQKEAGLLQPLPIPSRKWESIGMDFIVQLPCTTAGHDSILVVIDRLSKLVHLIPTTTEATALDVANLVIKEVVKHHGLPSSIVSDRDSKFTSHFWGHVMASMGTKLKMSTSFHPQTDGQTERVNRMIQEYLRHFVSAEQDDWDELLPLAEFALNDSYQESIGTTPFYLTYGQHPNRPAIQTLTKAPGANNWVSNIDTAIKRARDLIQAAQQRQKAYANQRRRELELQVGQKVLLSTKNIRLKSPGTHKLLPRYIGPFTVAKRVGNVAYQLELPSTMKMHNVFHVSLLKPYHSDGSYQPPPPLFVLDDDLYYEVEAVLQHKDVRRKGVTKGYTTRYYLIKWKGYGHEHNTWEPEDNLTQGALDSYWDKHSGV